MSKDEMQKYVAMSKNDKENQDKAIAEYLLQQGLNGHDEVPKPTRKKDANAPKNPKNAYLYYSQEQRPVVKAANPTASFGELVRLFCESCSCVVVFVVLVFTLYGILICAFIGPSHWYRLQSPYARGKGQV